MRIYSSIGEEHYDGYVADFRRTKPGSLKKEKVTASEDADDATLAYSQGLIEKDGLSPLLAAVFADPDGNPHFVGDEQFRDHVIALMVEYDCQLAAADPNKATESSTDEPVPDPARIDLPGNYLG